MPPKFLIVECIKQLAGYLDGQKKPLTNPDLLEFCKSLGEIQKGTVSPHLPHEIAESAVNFLIQEKFAEKLFNAPNPQDGYLDILKPIISLLPTQTWRSTDQIKWQQFSTPPGIAFLLTFLLNFRPGNQVLEPSAGTGSLAVWASGLGLITHTNEIDDQRRNLLESLGFKPTAYNGEFIHDFLPDEIEPDCVLMNPPFSSNGGRTASHSSKFGFRHVRSALERLKKGGKFGIILGNSAGLDTRTGENFWQKMSDRIQIKAIIKIAGREYSKNGTRVDVNLITGTKYQTAQENGWKRAKNEITSISVSSVEEGFALAQKLNLRLD